MTNTQHDWKKAEKQFYLPGTSPVIINVPSFKFFTIKGQGNPNDEFFGDYISVLYSLSYAVKMSHKSGIAPVSYHEYKVYPLEGIWDITDEAKKARQEKLDKDTLLFNLMIRQPDFVTDDFALRIIDRVKSKKYHPLLEDIRFESIEEGNCIQMMHTGPYDNEPASFRIMEEYCLQNSFRRKSMIHREIYLSDARKVSPDKLKTILRFGIIK